MISLPNSFIQSIERNLGPEAAAFFEALKLDSPTSIRLNAAKPMERAPEWKPVSWCASGFYLPSRPVFTLDPLFHAGAYYVQEAASMFLEQILTQAVDRSQALTVLDLSAAPGGKSTHLAALLSPHSLLVSNEVIRSRAKILAENCTKWGAHNVVVTNNDPSDFKKLPGFFDVVVVDAPCSGEGLFRKDPNAVNEWSEENVQLCAARQRRIVADVWDTLKPGGVIIYSTCTYNTLENEENLRWMMDEMQAKPIVIDASAFPEVTPSQHLPGFHFYPHKTLGEGFFIAALRKTDGSEFRMPKMKKAPLSKAPLAIEKELSNYVLSPKELEFRMFQDKVLAIPARHSSEIMQLIEKLSIVQCGTEMCELKGTNIIPSHALALSTILNKAHFQTEELDERSALTFQKKEELKPQSTAQYVLVTHKNIPLGFLKKAGNRYNNLYPKEWRIRMDLR